jgi:hypothetical protein
MAKKPYIYESLEGWLPITRKKSWFDPVNNPGDLAPYSEFQKPYSNDKEMSYPEWEWTWPDDTIGPIPDLTYPDPIENECSVDENCVWAGVIGPDEMECDECYTFSQAHLYYGCDVAPWWAAFGSWTLTAEMSKGNCYQLFTGPIMTTICCDEDAEGSFTVTYEGPLDCVGSKEVSVTCGGCCGEDGWTLDGPATVAAGYTWYGTISPACPDATCEVSSNSECELSCSVNSAGSEVTVGTSSGQCGQVDVTIFNPGGEECANATASDSFRITGSGNWYLKETSSDVCASGCGGGDGSCGGAHCSGGGSIDYQAPCTSEPYKYGTSCQVGGVPPCCWNNWIRQCKGTIPSCINCTPPPCGSVKSCSGSYYCAACGWWRCEWKCAC